MKKLTLSTVLLSLVLTGCANHSQCDATQTDPSMLEKINCDMGGGYQRQIEQKEQNLVSARAENEMFRVVYAEMDAQRQAVRQDLIGQQQQQAKLQNSLSSLLRQLKLKHAQNSATLEQIAQIETQMGDLTQNSSDDPAVLAAKEQELADLQRKVKLLQLSLGY